MAESIQGKSNERVSASLQELQDTVSRLSSHTGVEAVLILNREGDIIAESFKSKNSLAVSSSTSGGGGNNNGEEEESAAKSNAASMVSKLLKLATTYIQSLSPDDDISFMQMRTEKHREFYIAPHEGYVLALARR